MGRTLRRFYGVARSDFCAVWYHSKVRAIPQRKKASMRELQISVLTLFRFHPNIDLNFKILAIGICLGCNPKEGKYYESCCAI